MILCILRPFFFCGKRLFQWEKNLFAKMLIFAYKWFLDQLFLFFFALCEWGGWVLKSENFLALLEKSVIFPLKTQKHENWCWTYKIPGTLLKMLAIPHKMTAAPHVMLATTHLMFAKDQRGGLRSPPQPQGTPPTPILEKTLVSRNDF